MAFHKDAAVADGIHIIHAFEYADQAARLAATGFTASDVGKVARVLADGSFWVLSTHSPIVWVSISASGLVPASRNLIAGAGLTGGGDLSADRTFDVGANPDGSIVVGANDVGVGVLATDAQHGVRGGGTQHATAVPAGAAGFLSGADKDALDKLVEVLDEGVSLGTGTRKLNFVGSGVTAAPGGPGQVDITVSAGGGGVPASRTLTAGAGLTGGGDLSADRTFDVVANADGSIVVNADDVQVGVLATDAQHGVRGGGTQHAAVVPAGANGFMTGADKSKLDGIASGATNTPLTSTAPVNVTKAAAVVGVSTEAARQDHKHDVATAAPGAIAIGDVAAEGAATSLARSDHTHSLAAPGAPADVTKAAAAAGVSTAPARADHKHDVTTAAPAATGVATASGEGTATTLARSDHTHQSNTAPANVTKAAAAIGTSGEPARADHKHDVSTAAPGNVGDTNTEGTSTSLARADHVHHAMYPVLLLGASTISATTTTRYLVPSGPNVAAPTAAVQFRMPAAGTIRNLRVRINGTAGNGNNVVYTLRVNGVATALTCTIASTTADGSDLTNTVTVAAGDLIDIEVTKAASIGAAISDVIASMEVFV